MADALVSVVLEKLLSIGFEGIEQEVKLVAGVKKEIESLAGTLTIIQGVLQDAEDKQVRNKAVKFWLEEFKDISYDAEDILDEWRTRSLIPNVQHIDLNATVIRKVRSHLFSLFSCFKPIVVRHDIGNKIKELNERLVGVNQKIQTYGLRKIRSTEQHRPITSNLVVVEDIFGRDNDKDVILRKLLDESSHLNSHVPVISIVGTGGFGKTTLAQLILEQTKQLSKFKFDKNMWVCVSDPFNLEKVTKEIIEQAEGKVPDSVGWPVLHKSLHESIHEKRFILVLDDVWSHNVNDWRQLKQALDGGAKGSRILITTRNGRMAEMIDSSYTHVLGKLSNDDCWSLFKHIAFFGREDDLDKFEVIGKAISKKCNGVPLAARVIASLVRCKKTRQEWRDILESNIWEVQQGGEGFVPSILFSYYALPSYLKPCLMYCAVLPKDSEIKKEEMVQLWMAQGYLGSGDDGSVDLEKIGRNYFDDLAMLSFFQDFEKNGEGNITGCKMHDLIHDFVQFLTKNETIILEEEKVTTFKVRHLCAGDLGWSSIYQQKNLRTLRIHPKQNNTLALELLHQLTCLKALSLRGCGIQELPSEVGKLLHLRYLDLSNNYRLKELPETVCNLVNLQTLNLSCCQSLMRLPKAIAKLSSSIRHLHIEECLKLKYMPVGVGELRWLRTLDEFIVGGCDQENKEKGCTIEELRLLNHLEGCLKITVLDASNAAQAVLKMKKKLQSLEMNFCDEEKMVVGMEGILEDLEPHPNLENLMLKDYKGIRLPDWFFSMSNMTKLTLKDLPQCLRLPALGKVESIEVLHLDGLKSVKRLGSEFYGLDDTSNRQVIFPKLKVLILKNMEDCEEWDLPILNGVDFFPNLRVLEIQKFGGVLPVLGNLKSLETLKLKYVVGFNHSFDELLGIPTTASDIAVFPALKDLRLSFLMSWEEKAVIMRKEGEEEESCINIMPLLSELEIDYCPKLKVIPFYMFSHELKDLQISRCPELTGLQPSLPPLLEFLHLDGDIGDLSNSLLPLLHNNNNYPKNLNRFQMTASSQSSLPQGFNQLTSIQDLGFLRCELLDFGPDNLQHLTMLEYLEIDDCPILVERFGGGEEISSSSSHAYKILIRAEPINVHIGFSCDICEMNPIVGKRYKCKDCWDQNLPTKLGIGFDLCEECYNTPSKHTDPVNQHHRQSHTFELIENRGYAPIPVHLRQGHTLELIEEHGSVSVPVSSR